MFMKSKGPSVTQSLSQVRPTFLYPTEQRFPFDWAAREIVLALEARSWNVPGMKVIFDVYGSGHQKVRKVAEVEGENFRLCFGRRQRVLPGGQWADTAAIDEMFIPGKQLKVYPDSSRPNLYVYVGKDWATDKQWFFYGSKVLSRSYKQPRRYLVYKGDGPLQDGYHYALTHDDDLGREYDPRGDEPTQYETKEIFLEFFRWIEEHVLHVILAHPESSEPVIWPEDLPLVPFPTNLMGPMYTYIKYSEIHRIRKGQRDPNLLPLNERMALEPHGTRFLSMYAGDDTLSPLVYDGFRFAALGEIHLGTTMKEMSGYVGGQWFGGDGVAQITPSHASDIYIVDRGPANDYKNQVFEANPLQRELDHEQYRRFLQILGQTFVPVAEYDGSYSEPFVLIHRELDFNEVQIVIGPERQ